MQDRIVGGSDEGNQCTPRLSYPLGAVFAITQGFEEPGRVLGKRTTGLCGVFFVASRASPQPADKLAGVGVGLSRFAAGDHDKPLPPAVFSPDLAARGVAARIRRADLTATSGEQLLVHREFDELGMHSGAIGCEDVRDGRPRAEASVPSEGSVNLAETASEARVTKVSSIAGTALESRLSTSDGSGRHA